MAFVSLLASVSCATAQEESGAPVGNCVVNTAVRGRPLRVVSTVAPITSLIAQVVGEASAEVVGLVPEGTNSHTFEPPPSAAQVLET
ncbi:MAG: hypothetical protein EBX18_02905, partial [Actinobacteria bacterium]|nr:hypothetical protein [Actinomycetota bacterium]